MADPYELLLQELQKQQVQTVKPAFTPDEVRARIANNNQAVMLGTLGQLSGDQGISQVGGQVFKQALAGRNERVTNRGIQDPLTGETAVDPEYADAQNERHGERVFQLALRSRDAQQRATERADEQERQRQATQTRDRERFENRADLVRLAASLRPTPGSGSSGSGGSGGSATNKLPRPPSGFMWNEDGTGQVPVPGGPADIKYQAAKSRTQELARATTAKADMLIKEIDTADKLVGPLTTGLAGAGVRKVPGTNAFNLARAVETIKANIGFQELQHMRQASPTGGALGQVAIKELDMLQASLGNLDTAQDARTFKKQLAKVRQHFQNIKDTMGKAEAYDDAPAISAPPQAPATAPAQPGPGATPPQGGQTRRMRYDPATRTMVPM